MPPVYLNDIHVAKHRDGHEMEPHISGVLNGLTAVASDMEIPPGPKVVAVDDVSVVLVLDLYFRGVVLHQHDFAGGRGPHRRRRDIRERCGGSGRVENKKSNSAKGPLSP